MMHPSVATSIPYSEDIPPLEEDCVTPLCNHGFSLDPLNQQPKPTRPSAQSNSSNTPATSFDLPRPLMSDFYITESTDIEFIVFEFDCKDFESESWTNVSQVIRCIWRE
jgi:hypothetical protein